MNKKKLLKTTPPNDLRGFEEFIQSEPEEKNFLPRGVGGSSKKIEARFEHITFLSNDADRLLKLKQLLGEKIPFARKFNQSTKIIEDQKNELEKLKLKLFVILDKPNSPYRRSLTEVFDAVFAEKKL